MDDNSEKKVYGFQIFDNDLKKITGFMIYTKRENLLRPAVEDFEKGWDELFSLGGLIACLKYNKIKEVHTYHPNSETVCSHPYEINNDEDFAMCQEGGGWNRFDHMEIVLSHDEDKILEKENIQLTSLNEEESSKLEKGLRFHQY